MFRVKEIFYSVQGEGVHAGRPAVFCRFAGCNLWSGHEAHRTSAVCQFCDTDFLGGDKFASVEDLVGAIESAGVEENRFVILTGGEPALQVNAELITGLKKEGFEVAIETNGTLPLPPGIDWVCVSPKAGAPVSIVGADEIKFIYPQEGLDPWEAAGVGRYDHFVLQPKDGPDLAENTASALAFCLENPAWRLSLQLHKILGVR